MKMYEPITMLEYGTKTLKWLPLRTNQKAQKAQKLISSNHNA
jgi:hypothetical protein